MCFLKALLNFFSWNYLVVHPCWVRPEFWSKPSTRSQDKKHWAMNFRFPIPVWGHPVSGVEVDRWISGENRSLGKTLVWSYTKNTWGEKTWGEYMNSHLTLFIEINGRLHWGKTILVDYRDWSNKNGTSQWRVLFLVSHRCWCISPIHDAGFLNASLPKWFDRNKKSRQLEK